MFAIMPPPIFGDVSSSFRPTISSPLSSSPIRAVSPPLSPRDPNMLPRRDTQSSPIPAPKFKFASRPARHNPVLQKREVAQESRRRLFLKNVRQRADDRKWERRGGDQELLKLEWWSLNREYQQAKDGDLEGIITEAEVEEAAQTSQESAEMSEDNPDTMMVDTIEQEEEAELDSLIASMSQEPSSCESTRPESPHWSDDEDYDALFMDFFSQSRNQGRLGSFGDMEMS